MMLGCDDTEDASETMWANGQESATDFDEDCSPTKVCRNAREFSFDGFAEEGGDLQTAWRDKLAREGKLSGSAESIHDLVFGRPPSN
jgi:hypothetical protein